MKPVARCLSLVTACVILQSAAPAFAAAVISVNFVGGQTDPGFGGAGAAFVTGTAGFEPVGNWNNMQPNTVSSPAPIVNSAGSSAASVVYSSNNTWAATNSTPADGTNAALMNGYLDNFHAGGQSITV